MNRYRMITEAHEERYALILADLMEDALIERVDTRGTEVVFDAVGPSPVAAFNNIRVDFERTHIGTDKHALPSRAKMLYEYGE